MSLINMHRMYTINGGVITRNENLNFHPSKNPKYSIKEEYIILTNDTGAFSVYDILNLEQLTYSNEWEIS